MSEDTLKLLDNVVSAAFNIARIVQEQPLSENASGHLSQLCSSTLSTRDTLRALALQQQRARDSDIKFRYKGGRHPSLKARARSVLASSRHLSLEVKSFREDFDANDTAGFNDSFETNTLTINNASGTNDASTTTDNSAATSIPKRKIMSVNGEMVELSSDDSSEEDIPAIPKALRVATKERAYNVCVKKWKEEHGPKPFSLLTPARKEYQKDLRRMMANERMLRTRAEKERKKEI